MSWQNFWSKRETVNELIVRLEKKRMQIARDIYKSRLDGWWSYAIESLFGGDSENTKRRKGIEKIQALGRQLVEAQIVKMLLAGPRERVSLVINPPLGEEGEIDIFYTSKLDNKIEKPPEPGQFPNEVRLILLSEKLDNKTENPPAPDKLPNEVRPILLSDSIWNDAGKIWCAGGLFDSFLKRDLESMSPEERRVRGILMLFKEEHKRYNCIEKMLIEILLRRVNPEIFLEEVDLSYVNLNPDSLEDLSTAGIGNYGLKTLVLSHNRLETESVGILSREINRGRFSRLKELHLNDNELQGGDFVDHILSIVCKARLKTLNLSRNRQLGKSMVNEIIHPFKKFLFALPREMRSLTRLELRDVGFQAAQAPALSRALKEILLLEYLDLRENPDLIYVVYKDVIASALQNNFSLKTMLLNDVEAALQVEKVLECHQQMFDQLEPISSQAQPRFIRLLNYNMLGKDLPRSLLDFLQSVDVFRVIPFSEIINAISEERVVVLGRNITRRVPIHEQEYIAYLDIVAGGLRTFYQEVTEGVKNRDVEESLLALMQEKKVLALSSQVETNSRKDRSERQQECMDFLQDPNSKRSSHVLFQYPSQAELQENTGPQNVSQMQSDNSKQHAISKV